MSEQENRKDALEQLFQKKAREYDISYNENDWLNLEERLDNIDRQHRNKTRRLIAAAVILAFSLLAYFTVENQLQINHLNNQLSAGQTTQSQTQNTEKKTAKDTNKKHQRENSLTQNQGLKTSSKGQSLASGNSNTHSKSIDKNINDAGSKFKKYLLTEKHADIAEASSGFNGHFPAISTIKTANKISSTALSAESHNGPEALVENRDKWGNRTFRNASIGVVMGPDLSTVGSLSNFYDPGYKLGIEFNYNFSPSWGISAGFIRTRTRYSALNQHYNLPQNYPNGGISPAKTIGDCIMIDIPISVKYNFMHFSHSRLFATAGLSSYIMLDEQYRFKYNSNSSGAAQGWSGKTGTKYLFSNASFSLGYEFDLSRNWSLRAEPFLKVPIKQVGWGKVDLYSMGTMISLNFNILN